MKPFNLKEYLKNPERKVVTSDGRKVKRILCTDARGVYPVIALIEYDDTSDCAYSYTKDGRYHISEPCGEDLFFAPAKKEGWVNIFKCASNANRYVEYARIFQSKEDAEEAIEGDSDYITTLKIEWEE